MKCEMCTASASRTVVEKLRELSRTLLLLAIRKKFKPSGGLFRLWCLHLRLTCASHDHFAPLVQPLHFLDGGYAGLLTSYYGYAIFSKRGPYIVLNIVLPRDDDSKHELINQGYAFLRKEFGPAIVDTTPLNCQLESDLGFGVYPRKFCGSKEELGELRYSPAQRVVKCGDQIVKATPLASARDAIERGVRPIGATLADSNTARCWHRFEDDVVEFDNIVFDTPPPLVLERPDADTVRAFEADESQHETGEGAATLRAVRAFFRQWPAPDGTQDRAAALSEQTAAREAALVFLERADVDPQLKLLVACQHLNNEPITDSTVCMLHVVPGVEQMLRLSQQKLLSYDFVLLFEVAAHMRYPTRYRVKDFCDVVLRVALHAEWNDDIYDWLLSSRWLGGRLLRLGNCVLRQLMHRTRLVGPTVDKALGRIAGKWMREDALVAVLLRELDMAGFDTLQSLEALEARKSEQGEALFEVCEADAAAGRSPRCKGARRQRKVDSESRAESPAATLLPEARAELPATRVALCAQLQTQLGCPCGLVGSGIFSAESDMDVVVTALPAESFAAAVERVATFFGVPAPLDLSGERLTVVRGVFEGVPVDAQVWRGDGIAEPTESERATQRALKVTEALERSVRGAAGDDARLLHRWAAAAGAKGNALCRLPGIAVTAMAVVFGRRDGDAADDERLRHMLRALLDVLHDPVGPVVELGVAPARSARQDLCRSPLLVFVDGVNVAARLTVNTTRFLALLVRAGLRASAGDLLRPEHYRRATRAATVVAARVQPLRADAVPRTLRAALAKLDGHSLIEAVHVEREGVDLVVRAQLGATADARHRIASGVIAEADAGWSVTLRDARGRRWPLAKCHPAEAVDDACAEAPPRTARVVCDGRESVVPDAAYLTVDVLQHFAAPEWRAAP